MIIPSDGMILTHDTELQAGTYHLPSGLTISGDNVTLNGNGAVLVGQNNKAQGITLTNGKNVTIKNVRLRDYYHGIYAQDCRDLTITNCQTRASAEIPPNTIFLDIWKPADSAYGGGIFLWKVAHSRIENNDLQHQMNGLLTYQCSNLEVRHNVANYCSGFGFHLFETSYSQFTHNYADFCCRYQPRDEQHGHLGADAAGFSIVYKSCHNNFRQNYARLGGDGFFLSGLAPDGEHVDCSHNIFEENDGSYSPNNAFEATFSRGNEFRGNKANYSNYGFWLGFSAHSVMENNQIWGNRQAGIAVENGFDMTARGNDFGFNRHGILLWSKYVEQFARAVPENDTSRNWLIEENNFTQNDKGIRIAANQDHGIHSLSIGPHRLPIPYNHIIRHNKIWDNRVGIELQNVAESTVEENDMGDNLLDHAI